MTTLSHSESRRKYSWWWDSHNTPKNSKWLQENITDMDGKVKSMIKLIEEDADSFARRAEMYYKKRPELMKLVEEFYRAYRALAERYNHATGELRHAHQTIAEVFPDQVPFELIEDSPSNSLAQEGEPDAVFDVDELVGSAPRKEASEGGITKRGLKQLQEMFGGCDGSKSGDGKAQNEVMELSTENQNLKEKVVNETERAGKAEREVQNLKKALAHMETEKKNVLLEYQQCLGKLSKMEEELSNAKMELMSLNEKSDRAEIEVKTLKENLVQLEVEKIAGMIKHRECLEKISHLEAMASRFQEDMQAVDGRAFEAENQAQTLKDEMSRLQQEKEAIILQYQQCLEKISELENVISASGNEASGLKKQAERAEAEISKLKKAVADLNEEKEASALQYKYCLETISKLEKGIASANEDVKHLNNELLIRNAKLKSVEDKCSLLDMSNQALRVEADDLAKKIAMKDKELLNKEEELDKLQSCLKDENSRHEQAEVALQTLQNLHAQSQDEQKALALELKGVLQMLKDMEVSKCGLEEEIQQVRDENRSLSQTAVSMEGMQSEIHSLREIRERLVKEVSHHTGVSVSLHEEISCLKKEIEGLNRSYKALVEQVEAADLDPTCVGTSITSLKDENTRLKQICEQEINEKEILLKKLENVEEVLKKKVVAESSLSDLNGELETSREKTKALQDEKATLVAEKASLMRQLQALTESMNNLVRQNGVLEHSLSTAKSELEGLREKSKGLEEICDLLKDERSYLMSERDTLVLKLENVERRLESLEKQFTGLEEKYADLEKENDAMHGQVDELKVSLGEEKQERIGSQLSSETRMAGLENEIHLLQEENRWNKKESQEELDKAMKAQFEISILQKFMKDMEEKNCSLIIECQKHVEASKLAEKVISELESESLEQQVEAELLLDEIERLRLDIFQIFRALETGPYCAPDDKAEDEQTLIHHVLGSVEKMKSSISKHEDEKQLLCVENSVLLALLEQLESKGMEIELQKLHMEQDSIVMAEKLAIVKDEKDKLGELNRRLKSDMDEGHQAAGILQAELKSLCVKQDDLQKAYDTLYEAYSRVYQENAHVLRKLSDLVEEKHQVDQHNEALLLENLASANQSVVLKSSVMEKIIGLNSLLQDLKNQQEVNDRLEKEMAELGRKLELQKAEKLVLKDAVCSLEGELQDIRECNLQMKQDIVNGKENLMRSEAKLLDTETKLEATENLNSKLCRTVVELKSDIQMSQQVREDLEKDVSRLSETNSKQKKEIESLQSVNKSLESELDSLQGKNNEFELWEAEAATFCFDLQVSSVNEVLLKNKVQELTGVCKTLEQKYSAKTTEIEQMKGQLCSMENEVSSLKSQLSAYGPVVASLRDDITLIEHNALLRTKLKAANCQDTEFSEGGDDNVPLEDQSLISLQNLQTRVKAVGRLMQQTNKQSVLQRRSISKTKQEPAAVGEIEELKTRPCLGREKHERIRKKGYANELMKDIPLDDQVSTSMRKKGNDDLMLELWESTESGDGRESVYDHVPPSTDSDMEKEFGVDKLKLSNRIIPFNEPNQDVLNDTTILEKLDNDGEKLETLQTTVEHLRWKLETNKKAKKSKNVECEAVKQQLQEAEDTIVLLFDLNGQLVKNIEDCPPDEVSSPKLKQTVKTWRIKVMEQAEKGSERIERLQVLVQKIQAVMSRFEDDGKIKGRNKFLKSRTVILRDFIDNGKKYNGIRKKGPRCGCFRQSTSGKGMEAAVLQK
ncbi:hypothetical protein ACS0TY_023224 [Phlomoides rotata]